MKKRGDAARQLIMAKDDEIQKLRNSNVDRKGEKLAAISPSTPLTNTEKNSSRTDHHSPAVNVNGAAIKSSEIRTPDSSETKYESSESIDRKVHQVTTPVSFPMNFC